MEFQNGKHDEHHENFQPLLAVHTSPTIQRLRRSGAWAECTVVDKHDRREAFETGRVVATLAARNLLGGTIVKLLERHIAGDWGNVCNDDWEANNDALSVGDRILSAYVVGDEKYYVITEHDRSATTVMIASEY